MPAWGQGAACFQTMNAAAKVCDARLLGASVASGQKFTLEAILLVMLHYFKLACAYTWQQGLLMGHSGSLSFGRRGVTGIFNFDVTAAGHGTKCLCVLKSIQCCRHSMSHPPIDRCQRYALSAPSPVLRRVKRKPGGVHDAEMLLLP